MGFKRIALVSVLLLVASLLLPALLLSPYAMADTWTQSAPSGMDDSFERRTGIASSMAVYGGNLYVGTVYNYGAPGVCEVWRYDGATLTQVVGQDPAGTPGTGPGFGDSNNIDAPSMQTYTHGATDYLYVGTTNYVTGCEVWRYDGANWTQVNIHGFGDVDNYTASSMAVYDSNLYVGTANNSTGCQVWETAGTVTTPYTDWAPADSNGFGDLNNTSAASMEVYTHDSNTYLYVGTNNDTDACEVWSFNGTSWAQVNINGFSVTKWNRTASSMAVYNHGGTDYLYVGTYDLTNDCQVWRTDGSGGFPYNWTQVNVDGFGVNNNHDIRSMVSWGGFLYAGSDSSGIYRADGTGGPPYTWTRVNADEFTRGNYNQVYCMAVYGTGLYAGTKNYITGCEVWKTGGPPFNDWEVVNDCGFSPNNNETVSSQAADASNLYAGTWSGSGCEVWENDGSNWNQVNVDGFGDWRNEDASSMAFFGSDLYVGTHKEGTGCDVWRYDDPGWTQVVGQDPPGTVGTGPGFGNPDNRIASAMCVFNNGGGNKLYVATTNTSTGCEVWRYDGANWTQVSRLAGGLVSGIADGQPAAMTSYNWDLYIIASNKVWVTTDVSTTPYTWDQANVNGFGDPFNTLVTSMTVHGGCLYAGTLNWTYTGGDGCEVWRTDGSGGMPHTWTLVGDQGFGDVNNFSAASMLGFNGKLYVGTGWTPCEVWSTSESGGPPYNDWTQENTDGFGDADNSGDTVSMAEFQSDLFVGTDNWSTGCEVWETSGTPQPAPTITSISPTSGPVGTTVTIDGTGFGAVRGTSYVKFGGKTAAASDYVSWSDTKVKCKVPSGATTGQVKVTTGAGTSNGKTFTVTTPSTTPTITSISPNSGEAETTEVTIKGTNFGATRSGSGQTGGAASYVSFGTTGVTDYTSWSDTQIKCTAPSGISGDVDVTVTTDSGTSNSKRFTVTTPTWYLAEGTTAWGFGCYISIENPNNSAVSATVTYMTDAGAVPGGDIDLPANSQATIDVSAVLGEKDFSTRVECKEGKTIAVDRTMTWTGPGAPSPDGHCSIGVTSAATTWYLAEGSSAWGFECWLLIQNPNQTEATAQVTYMIEGADPVTVEKKIPATSRKTYNMANDIGAKDASIKVTADMPVIPERAMYKNNKRSGHDSIGTTAPATDYYLAEGTTDWGFTTYVLVQNPNDTATDVTVTYMTSSGAVPQAPFNMPGNSRKTIRVNDVLPASDFSTQVTGSQPIIAERAMYWGEGTALGEASHDSIGLAAPHTTFYIPDGQTSDGRETYTLVQNPNDTEVTVEVSYLTPDGTGNVTFEETVGANSRRTFSMVDKGIAGRAAVMVTCKTAGKKIMCERAMYWNNRGAGTDTIGGYSD